MSEKGTSNNAARSAKLSLPAPGRHGEPTAGIQDLAAYRAIARRPPTGPCSRGYFANMTGPTLGQIEDR